MALYGYARVSTEDQTNDPQLHRLNAEGVTEITTDVISGSVNGREPRLDAPKRLDRSSPPFFVTPD